MISTSGRQALVAVAMCCLFTVSLGFIIDGPVNTAVVNGDSISITCHASTLGTEVVQFYEYATNANGAQISNGGALLPGHPNYSRYRLTVDGPAGLYTLFITETNMFDGGVFECRDISTVPFDYRKAHLVLLDGAPNCTNSLPPNGLINLGAYYSATCIIQYAIVPPYMDWLGPGQFDQTWFTNPVSAWSGMAFYAQKEMDGLRFTGRTYFRPEEFINNDPNADTSAPSLSFNYFTQALFLQWAPYNMTYTPVQQSYEVGQVLTCYADALPVETIKWINMLTFVEYPSRILTLTTDMIGYLVLRCEATNTVGTGNLFINITVNPITTPTTPPPPTTTTTAPAISTCDDLSGKWVAQRDDGTKAQLCLEVNNANSMVRGFVLNRTTDQYFPQAFGQVKTVMNDLIGFTSFSVSGPRTVSSFAGECRKCRGTEHLIVNSISRTSEDYSSCQDGGTLVQSETLTYFRQSTTGGYPC